MNLCGKELNDDVDWLIGWEFDRITECGKLRNEKPSEKMNIEA